jgi:hypothetical protein
MRCGRKQVSMSGWKVTIGSVAFGKSSLTQKLPLSITSTPAFVTQKTFLALRIQLPFVFPSWRVIHGIELL